MLSSTIRTLIGGTAVTMPESSGGLSAVFFFLGREIAGLGEATRGGGVATRWIAAAVDSGAGGVGSGGGAGGLAAEVPGAECSEEAFEWALARSTFT